MLFVSNFVSEIHLNCEQILNHNSYFCYNYLVNEILYIKTKVVLVFVFNSPFLKRIKL